MLISTETKFHSLKLFSRKRLQITGTADETIIKWWSIGFWDIIIVFVLPFMLMIGISELLGYKELFGRIEIIQLNLTARVIFWSLVAVMVLHLFKNRIAVLKISNARLLYKKGVIPGVKINVPLSDISSASVESYEDPIAESSIGIDNTEYRLVITFTKGKKKKIKGLSEKDANQLVDIISSKLN